MEQFIHLMQQIWAWVMLSGPNAVVALQSVIAGLIAFFMLIPGEQPERFLQSCLDWLKQFSKK